MAPSATGLLKLVTSNTGAIKVAWRQASQAIRTSFRTVGSELQPVLVHVGPRQPTHPLAVLKRRNKAIRSYSSHHSGYCGNATRPYATKAQSGKSTSFSDRNSFARNTRIGSAIHHSSGRAPFASTLRPNLTGGTLNRTAGGYAFGAGGAGRSARYFSHSPAAPAQVIHSVSQAVRAFVVSGQKAQFDGVDPRTGENRFRAVSALQDETTRKVNGLPKTAPGSYIDFNINPTVTVLTPLASADNRVSFAMQQTLCNDDLLDVLSVDFSRTLKELAVVLHDLKKLSTLGDLPITYRKSALRVHFPGCDYATVEKLCTEIGIQRALIMQDEDFVEAANLTGPVPVTALGLQFPLAPVTYDKGLDPEDHHQDAYYCSKEDMKFARAASRDQIEWQNMVEATTTAPQQHLLKNQAADAVSSAMTVTGSLLDDINDSNLHIVDDYRNSGHLSPPDGFDTLNSSELDDITIPLPCNEHRNLFQHQDGGDVPSSGYVMDRDTGSGSYVNPVEDYQGFEGIYRFIEQCDSAVRR